MHGKMWRLCILVPRRQHDVIGCSARMGSLTSAVDRGRQRHPTSGVWYMNIVGDASNDSRLGEAPRKNKGVFLRFTRSFLWYPRKLWKKHLVQKSGCVFAWKFGIFSHAQWSKEGPPCVKLGCRRFRQEICVPGTTLELKTSRAALCLQRTCCIVICRREEKKLRLLDMIVLIIWWSL